MMRISPSDASLFRTSKKNPRRKRQKGVHHWDENGLLEREREPREIQQIHADEIKFVKSWLKEWRRRGKWKMDRSPQWDKDV